MDMITKAIILGGGVDLPLIPGFEDVSKALLPVANVPALYYSISNLRRHGVREVFITCSAQKENLFRQVLHPLEQNIHITYVPESFPQGTAGTISHIAKEIAGEPFWVLNGGLITNLDFSRISKFHLEKGATATIITKRLHIPNEGISLDKSGRVDKIHLFHKSRDRRRTYTPCGVYLLNSEVAEYIDPDAYFDLKEQLIPRLYKAGLHVQIYEVNGEGYVRQVRTLLDFYEANWDVLDRRLLNGFSGGQKMGGDEVWIGEGASIARSAHLIGPVVIGKGAIIEDECQIIGPAVIGDYGIIKAGTILRESVLLPRSIIPMSSRVEYALWSDKQEVHCFRENGNPRHNYENGHPVDESVHKNSFSVYSYFKRITDILFSAAGLVFLFPLFLIIAVIVKLDSNGPVFYTQRRCGVNGMEFPMVKFRTMIFNAEKLQEELSKTKDVDGPVFKMVSDPRITKVGGFLRRTSLDELPQLWNVFKGEMSLIGPRPLIMEEMKCNPLWRDIRLSVKPGITGLWQINGRGEKSFHEWIKYDISYVQDQSFPLDIKIFIKTIRKSFCGGAS